MGGTLHAVPIWMVFGLWQLSSDALDQYVERVQQVQRACGPTCAWYCLRRLGHDVRLEDVWREAGVAAEGTTLLRVRELLTQRGVWSRALALAPTDLESLPPLSILVVNGDHCIVFERLEADRGRVTYYEPSNGEFRTVSRRTLEKGWRGEAIVLDRPPLPWIQFVGLTGLTALAIFLPLEGLKRRCFDSSKGCTAAGA